MIYVTLLGYSSSFCLLSDDTNMFCTGKDRKEVENLLNSELYNLNKWFEVNKLTLNLTKTKYMIFGNHNENCSVSINNDAIEKVDSIKFQKYFVVLNTVHSHNTRSSSRDNFYCHAVRTKLKLFCHKGKFME